MKPFEEALLKTCAVSCAVEIHKTLKLFKDVKHAESVLLKLTVIKMIQEHLKDLQNVNRD